MEVDSGLAESILNRVDLPIKSSLSNCNTYGQFVCYDKIWITNISLQQNHRHTFPIG